MWPNVFEPKGPGVYSGALAQRERRLRLVRLSEVVAAAGAITVAVAGIAMFDSIGPGAVVATVVGLALLVAGALAAQRLRRTVRYRVDKPNSTVWLAGKIALLLVVLIGAMVIAAAVEAPSLPRTVLVVVLVGALAAVVNSHAARWTLFQADATGLKVGQAGVPWPAVARIDVVPAGPGLVEIGILLVAGQVVGGTPRPGVVLRDLPVCTLVPATAVHPDHIAWAVREFGNPAIPVVPRAQHPNTPPAPTAPASAAPAAPTPPAPTPPAPSAPAPTPPAPTAAADAGPPATEVPEGATAVVPAGPAGAAEADEPEATVVEPVGPQATAPANVPGVAAVAPPFPPAAPPYAPMPGWQGPQQYPYMARSRRRGWLIGVALGLAVVLVAGVVTAIVLIAGDDEGPGKPISSESQPQGKYSAAKVGESCELIDVDVMKPWSTVPEIATEPSSHKLPGYDLFTCSAHSDSEYVEGRVVNLDLSVAVAESPKVARDFHDEQVGRGYWNADGEVQERGEVSGLGEAAEFEHGKATVGEQTRTGYVLRVVDANLVVLLRFGSSADQSDGAGVGVEELADTARAEVEGVMDTLLVRPAAKKDPKAEKEPADVPKTVNEAATLPGTADLMERVRNADACELHDRAMIGEFGTVAVEPHQALGLSECRLMATTDPAAPRTVFGLDLTEYLAEEDRADLVRAEIDGREVFHTEDNPGFNSCTYYVPHGNSGFGAEIKVIQYVEGLEEQGPWPAACEVAEKYTSKVADRVAELPRRSAPAPEPTLIGKDPCMAEDVVNKLMPGWKLGPISRYYPAGCQFTLTKGDESYDFDLSFDRDAEQDGDGPASIGGLTGQWFNAYEGQCGVSLIYVPESAPEAWDAQNIGVSIMQGNYGAQGSQDLCALTQSIAEMLIDKVGS